MLGPILPPGLVRERGAPAPWVRWLAQDADGAWWGYEAEPHEGPAGWYENEVGRLQRIGCGPPNPDWRQTLSPYRRSPTGG